VSTATDKDIEQRVSNLEAQLKKLAAPDSRVAEVAAKLEKTIEAVATRVTTQVATKIVAKLAETHVGQVLEGPLLPDAMQLAVERWHDAPIRVEICVLRSVSRVGRTEKTSPLPTRATTGSAGYDLRYCPPSNMQPIALRPVQSRAEVGYSIGLDGKLTVYPGGSVLLPTGIAIAVPEGYEAQVRPRSGLSCEGVIVGNSPGTVDSDFRIVLSATPEKKPEPAEIKVLLRVLGKTEAHFYPGDRIAQLVFAQVHSADLHEVDRDAWIASNAPADALGARAGGFGSTGAA
jgi:dUTP pyrophosphatase